MLGEQQITVLCLQETDRRHDGLRSVLTSHGYKVLCVSAADHGVAFMMNNHVDAIVLDGQAMPGSDFSVAQTFKMLKPSVLILLLEADCKRWKNVPLPAGIDAVCGRTPEECVPSLQRLLKDLSVA